MTQPVPPDPVLVEIRDLLREIRDQLAPKSIEIKVPAAMPARTEPPKRPPPARSGIG